MLLTNWMSLSRVYRVSVLQCYCESCCSGLIGCSLFNKPLLYINIILCSLTIVF